MKRRGTDWTALKSLRYYYQNSFRQLPWEIKDVHLCHEGSQGMPPVCVQDPKESPGTYLFYLVFFLPYLSYLVFFLPFTKGFSFWNFTSEGCFDCSVCGSSGKVDSRNFLLEPTWLQNSFSIFLPLIHLSISFMCVLLFNPLIPDSCNEHKQGQLIERPAYKCTGI